MEKIKILLLSASPENMNPLNLTEEAEAIQTKIRLSDYRDLLDFTPRWEVSPDKVIQALNENQPHIVHFSGHGKTKGINLISDDNHQSITVEADKLKVLFEAVKDNIQVVFLNNCFSEQSAHAISDVIDCTIGMNTAVENQSAIVFAASFYRAIGFGKSVQEAFEQGRAAVQFSRNGDVDTPVLIPRREIDPSRVFPLSFINNSPLIKYLSEDLKVLVKSGSEFISVQPEETAPISPNDYIFLKLKLKSESIVVIGISRIMKVEDAATSLAKVILPDWDSYNWTLKQGDKLFEPNELVKYTSIKLDKEVKLNGKPILKDSYNYYGVTPDID